MNVLRLFKSHTYLTECQFCFKSADEVETLVVSREGRTSICNECASLAIKVCQERQAQANGG